MDNKASKLMSLFILVAIITALVVMGCQTTTKVNKVAAPIFTPPGGVYDQPQTVSITCATPGAEIRYTLDGSDPPANSYVYTGPFTVEMGTVVKAMAFKAGYEDSKVVTAWYEQYYYGVVGRCLIEGGAGGVAVSGSYAYVTGWGDKCITVVNIANKTNPVVVKQHSLPYYPHNIAISGNTVFVMCVQDWESILVAIDVTNPRSPQTKDSFSLGSRWCRFVVEDGYAYIADGDLLRVIDVSNPNKLRDVGSCSANISGGILAISVSGNTAFTAISSSVDDYSGIYAFNVSDPSNPALIGSLEVELWWHDIWSHIYAEGNYVYVVSSYSGLKILDVSDPTDMRIVGTHGGYAYGLAKYSDYIFTIDGYADLTVIDVTNPTQPWRVSSGSISGDGTCIYDLSAEGGYLYATEVYDYYEKQMDKLLIIDVSMLVDHKLPTSKQKPLTRNMTK